MYLKSPLPPPLAPSQRHVLPKPVPRRLTASPAFTSGPDPSSLSMLLTATMGKTSDSPTWMLLLPSLFCHFRNHGVEMSPLGRGGRPGPPAPPCSSIRWPSGPASRILGSMPPFRPSKGCCCCCCCCWGITVCHVLPRPPPPGPPAPPLSSLAPAPASAPASASLRMPTSY